MNEETEPPLAGEAAAEVDDDGRSSMAALERQMEEQQRRRSELGDYIEHLKVGKGGALGRVWPCGPEGGDSWGPEEGPFGGRWGP